jgi:hypothetical protein
VGRVVEIKRCALAKPLKAQTYATRLVRGVLLPGGLFLGPRSWRFVLVISVLATGVLATGVLATGVLATGVLATGVLATGVLATGVLTTGVLTTGVLTTGVLTTGVTLPGALTTRFLVVSRGRQLPRH